AGAYAPAATPLTVDGGHSPASHRPHAHLHLTVAPADADVQLGFAGGVAGHVASMHSPVAALGGSSTKVAVSGRFEVETGYAPFFPFALNFTRPGWLGVSFTPTWMMPCGFVPGFL